MIFFIFINFFQFKNTNLLPTRILPIVSGQFENLGRLGEFERIEKVLVRACHALVEGEAFVGDVLAGSGNLHSRHYRCGRESLPTAQAEITVRLKGELDPTVVAVPLLEVRH